MGLKQRYKLKLCFDGTLYSGWQKQPAHDTVQSTLEKALEKLFSAPVPLRGSSRTDAGVHAKEFVAHFDVATLIEPSQITKALNHTLPADIRIMETSPVDPHFHACFSAKKKHYLYRFSTQPISPFQRLYCTHLRGPIDLNLIEQALPLLTGTHNFLSFANQGEKGAAKANPIKTIYSITLERGKTYNTLHFHGDGFLYKMVRNLVGALLEVGRGHLTQEALTHLLQLQDRKVAPPPAPAKGLCLEKVYY